MTTKKLNKLAMYLAVEGICNDNDAWPSLPAFADAYADFQLHVTNIQTLSQTQSQPTTGITLDKKAARQNACALALPIAQAVHAYAVKNKNNQLAAQVDFSMSDLTGGRDLQAAERCQNIYTTANTNLVNLTNYGVTAGKLTALGGAIVAYKLLISQPRDTRAQGKTVTGTLETEFAAADEDLVMLDDLLGQYADPKFVSDFQNARVIVDITATHESPQPPTPPTPGK